MEGYVWYHKRIYSGTKEEYFEFCDKHEDVELVMTLYNTTPEKLETVAANLNNSNFIENLQKRGKK